MRISRFYYPHHMLSGEQYSLDKEQYHYVVNVLRLKVGDSLVLFDGQGTEVTAKVHDIKRHELVFTVETVQAVSVESNIVIHLVQAVCKNEKMDFAIQKAVELGVHSITPVLTEFTQVHLTGNRRQKKTQHWQNIVQSACEQSGRTIVPWIFPLMKWDEALRLMNTKVCTSVVLSPEAEQSITKVKVCKKQLIIAIGPEGGFSDDEYEHAYQHGFLACHMGPRILRAETATVTALSLCQGFFGDF